MGVRAARWDRAQYGLSRPGLQERWAILGSGANRARSYFLGQYLLMGVDIALAPECRCLAKMGRRQGFACHVRWGLVAVCRPHWSKR